MAPNLSLAPEAMRDLVFKITGPSQQEIEFGYFANVRPPKSDDFISLAPGETVEQTIQIESYYRLIELGPYSIQVIYQNQSDPGNEDTAWKGEITSNAVTITLQD